MTVLDDVVDLSVPIYEGMPVDDLGPKFWVRLSHEYARQLYQDTQSREGRVFLTTDHVGTHLDGPLRFDPKGLPIEEVPIEQFIRSARLLDLRAVGRSVQAARSTRRVCTSRKNSTYTVFGGERLDGEEVAGECPAGLGPQEGLPKGNCPPANSSTRRR